MLIKFVEIAFEVGANLFENERIVKCCKIRFSDFNYRIASIQNNDAFSRCQ